MPSTIDFVTAFASNAKNSSPPEQWVWAGLLFVSAGLAGYLLSNQEAQAALEQADLDIQKKRIEDMQRQLQEFKDEQDAAALRAQIRQLQDAVAARTAAWQQTSAQLAQQRQTLQAAQSWKDLG